MPFAVVATTDPARDMIAFQAAEVPDAGPQASVTLLRADDHDELGIKLSHVPVDGQGAKQYAYLLALTYSRLKEDSGYAPAPNLLPRPTAE